MRYELRRAPMTKEEKQIIRSAAAKVKPEKQSMMSTAQNRPKRSLRNSARGMKFTRIGTNPQKRKFTYVCCATRIDIISNV